MRRIRSGRWWGAAALLLLLLPACTTTRPYVSSRVATDAAPPPDSARAYCVFLVGNAGAPDTEAGAAVLRTLRAHLSAADTGAVVFLGDNVYPSGLPEEGAVGRAAAEARLEHLIAAVEGWRGRVFFVPGDRDWRQGQPGGHAARSRLEAFVETRLGRGDVFVPDDGLPGPAEIPLTDHVTLVALDTQWWLTGAARPYGEADGYTLDEPGDFLLQLDDVIARNDDRRLLVVGHHPLYANGKRGGHFPLRRHLLPLPLVGSLHPLYVKYFGGRQDLAHPTYRQMRRHLGELFTQHDGLVYAAAHDAGLQYFARGGQHHLVSGGGSRAGFVAGGHGAAFSYGGAGFLALQYYRDGAVWLEAWAPGEAAEGQRLFRTELSGPLPDPLPGSAAPSPAAGLPDYRDSTVVVAANPRYRGGALRAFLFGRGHRQAWATSVEVPVLDLAREAGGLTPLRLGGGAQTLSLRMRGADGFEYVLRSVDKRPGQRFDGGVEAALAQDRTSATHPYATLVVPRLAAALGLYHAPVRLVYVPDDPRLGRYREAFGGRLALLEPRPDDDMSAWPAFGNATNVVGAARLTREVTDDHDHRVDARAYLRARLLDLLVADWDRHADQWRWAAFEPHELDTTLTGDARTRGKVYRPIPRDHDFAFNRRLGPYYAVAKRFVPKLQDFGPRYGYLIGLTTNGLDQDRRFLAALSREDWEAEADSVRRLLADAVVEDAFGAFPAPVFARDGARLAAVLKARRDRLPHVAGRFYGLLARVVDVVGSHEREHFTVEHLPGGRMQVTVAKGSGDRSELFRRTFDRRETGEVRLYGLDGDDRFVVSGPASGIRVRAVGGTGEDTFIDASRGAGPGWQTRFYDTDAGNHWEAGAATSVVRSPDPAVNRYDPHGYAHDTSVPLLFFGRNPDDGLFVGGGVRHVRHGFRKQPYAHLHELKANVATATRAFNVVYRASHTGVLGGWDLGVGAKVLTPNNVRNFYGLGNETQNTGRDAHYYQARLKQAVLDAGLVKRVPGAAFGAGPVVAYTKVEPDTGRFVVVPQPGLSPATFGDQLHAGLQAALTLESVDGRANPRQGFRWDVEAAAYHGLRTTSTPYGRAAAALTLYYAPLLQPQVTVALRVGGAHNFGAFPFFAASTLGGEDNLRGYRSTRFAGRTSFFQNVEVRAALFDLRGRLASGQAGVLAFVDNGRVWTDGERSRAWHQGYGGGLWLHLFDQYVVSATVGVSAEGAPFSLRLGFLF